jgi:lactate dehydrogenase-like 2-hydroxyacid dehydrogenase
MMSHGFNCQILYTGPNEKTSNASTVGSNVQYCSLEELLEKSDIVSLHLPLNESTQHFFNANCFKRMKSNAIVINTSRGEIIDQEALYLALKNKEIAGAGLDVTTPEPLPPSHPLFGVQNCIILPHIGSATIKTRQAMADIAIQNLLAGIFQQELLHSVR